MIDKVSLQSYIKTSELVKKLDEQIAKAVSAKITPEKHKFFLEDQVSELHRVGIKTIAELDDSLVKFSNFMVPFAENLLDGACESLTSGICIFYLCYIILGCEGSFDKLVNYLEEFNLTDTSIDDSYNDFRVALGYDKTEFAEQVISICDKIKNSEERR